MAPMGSLGRVVAAVVSCVTVVSAVSCSSTRPTSTTAATTATLPAPPPAVGVERVVLVGDSLAEEAADGVRFFASPTEVVGRYYGGTAPCDWVKQEVPADPSSVVVLSFTGNNLTPCMADGAGGFLQGGAVLAKYRVDMTALIDRARGAGAWVMLVGQPAQPPSGFLAERVDALNALYRELAQAPYVAFVDAGATVERPDGSYTTALVCLAWEPECSPTGENSVRGAIHFCPEVDAAPCPVYSSGALRFGSAIAAAAIDPAPLDPAPLDPAPLDEVD